MQFDPVTLEVIRNRLDVIAEEMQTTLVRSAHSTIIKEAADCSAAIFDTRAQLISQANGIPTHLGALSPALERICEEFPPEKMAAGDVFVMNDPYEGGQHLPDILIAVPVVVDSRVVALTCCMAHAQDIGGKSPGSTPTDATELYQEGLIIPPMKLYSDGQPNKTLFALIRKNVRIPNVVLGDIAAEVAANNTGRHRLLALFTEHGTDLVLSYVDELQRRAEAMTRQLIEQIPDGEYSFVDYLDNDGIDLDRRIRIQVKVIVEGTSLTVDFEGTSPQVRGPFNAVPSVALSGVRYVVRAITDPDLPNNAGCYRPISIRVPPRSIVNPAHPAAVNNRAVTLRRMIDAIMGALVQAIPDRITAANNGHPLMCSVGGWDPELQQRYVTSILTTGGMGARPTKDGIDVVHTDASNSRNVPVEVMETYFPLRAICWRQRDDSGGPGKWRGGLGLEYRIRVERGEALFSHRGERHYTAPWGLFGGGAGACSKTDVIRASGQIESVPSKGEIALREGDEIHFFTTGGGGYGDPLERSPSLVLADIQDRKVSPAVARDVYGVVRSADTENIDDEATAARRQSLAQQRGEVRWTYDRGGDLGRER